MTYLTRDPIPLAAWRRLDRDARDGASVEFLGMVRGSEGDRAIAALEYKAYEPMAERVIGRLVEEAKARWGLHRVAVRHRIGRVEVGGLAVLIGVQAPHRAEAFAACRFLLEQVKAHAPIWKHAETVEELHVHV